ncbi:hypothetical protein BU24DRAFT_429147 [Aaosphaeria arxii CBS 175.79]|uniref:Uncharacterized protein n=1 Tax=Aaosphaeria arxii CBS 175.79 TaxID=1450172 RepID=A0A6A5X7U5_9PLEO|nr:uncharacterized protein BU24DRAFT_429147 [Aaosphaeria arxii CBS 175.79]KAF2008887.1 hypothetical protein BU24DRAFT_429147 [Aaosphaeria arxii CBS 175.79]
MESNNHQQHQPNASLPSESPVQSTDATPTTTTTASLSTTTTTHEQQLTSSESFCRDPFSPNYCYICPLNEQEKAEWIATWPLPLRADHWEVYESAEHAEVTRPFDQLRVLLRQRGLDEEFMRIMSGSRDQTQADGFNNDFEERYEEARKFLRGANEGELLERAEEI